MLFSFFCLNVDIDWTYRWRATLCPSISPRSPRKSFITILRNPSILCIPHRFVKPAHRIGWCNGLVEWTLQMGSQNSLVQLAAYMVRIMGSPQPANRKNIFFQKGVAEHRHSGSLCDLTTTAAIVLRRDLLLALHSPWIPLFSMLNILFARMHEYLKSVVCSLNCESSFMEPTNLWVARFLWSARHCLTWKHPDATQGPVLGSMSYVSQFETWGTFFPNEACIEVFSIKFLNVSGYLSPGWLPPEWGTGFWSACLACVAGRLWLAVWQSWQR